MLNFTPADDYDVGTDPRAVVAADFNNDGQIDLATANHDSNNVSVLLGDGVGGFGAAQNFAGGWYPRSLAVADFNGDSKLDLVEADYHGVVVLKGNADGTFEPAARIGSASFTPSSPMEVAVGHFNDDGNIDVVLTDHDDLSGIGGAVWVLLGNGQGGVTSEWIKGMYPRYGLLVADLDLDGKVDVATAGYAMLGDGNGTLRELWTASWAGHPDHFPRAAAVGDLSGDGIPDLVTAGYAVSVGRGLGNGSFNSAFSQLGNGPFTTAVATGDFNGDGKLDVVTTESDADVWLGNGDGTLREPRPFATGTGPVAIAVGDFNGDGRPDVAVANRLSNTVSVLLNDGVWQQAPPLPGDYNRNGEVDAADQVLWRHTLGESVAAPYDGADGDGDGVVDQDDRGVWMANFGRMLPPPAAGSGMMVATESEAQWAQAAKVQEKSTIINRPVVEPQAAVEAQGASEKQRAKLTRESSFVELAAPSAVDLTEVRRTARSSSRATVAHAASRRDDALLLWLTQHGSQHEVNDWQCGDLSGEDETNGESDATLSSIDEMFALLTSG
jgi:hypothetical protein